MPIFSLITLGLAPILSPEQHHEEMHQPVLLAGVDPLQLVSGAYVSTGCRIARPLGGGAPCLAMGRRVSLAATDSNGSKITAPHQPQIPNE